MIFDENIVQIVRRINTIEKQIRELFLRLSGSSSSGDLVMIQDVVVGAAGAADITFSNIPATYKHLRLMVSLRTDRAANPSDFVKLTLNADTGNNYQNLIAYFSSGITGYIEQAVPGAPCAICYVSGSTAPANTFSDSEIMFLDYANTNTYKGYNNYGGQKQGIVAGTLFLYNIIGWWTSTAAISTIKLAPNAGPNFVQYSRATLYGMK